MHAVFVFWCCAEEPEPKGEDEKKVGVFGVGFNKNHVAVFDRTKMQTRNC